MSKKILHRSGLSKALAESMDIPLAEADRNVQAMLEVISQHLKGSEGHEVRLKGFGALRCKRQKPRRIKLPGQDQYTQSKEKLTVRFHAYPDLEVSF